MTTYWLLLVDSPWHLLLWVSWLWLSRRPWGRSSGHHGWPRRNSLHPCVVQKTLLIVRIPFLWGWRGNRGLCLALAAGCCFGGGFGWGWTLSEPAFHNSCLVRTECYFSMFFALCCCCLVPRQPKCVLLLQQLSTLGARYFSTTELFDKYEITK